MSRRKSDTDIIPHPLFRYAYLKKRGNSIYMHVHFKGKEVRRSTGLIWHLNNRQRALRMLEILHDKIVLGSVKSILIGDLFEDFLNLKSKSVTLSTVKKYKQSFSHWLDYDLTTDDPDRLKKHLIEQISKSKLHVNTINKSLQLLSVFFNYLVSNNFIDKNPVNSSLMPKSVQLTPTQFTDVEIDALLNHFEQGSEMHSIIKLIALTGLRIQEVINLKREDLHKDYLQVHGKGGYLRQIPVLEGSELALLVKHLKSKPKPIKYQITDYPHTKLVKACRALKLKARGFHSIRKYFENKLIDSGINIKVAAQILGHTTQVQSKNYITKLKLSELKKELEKL
ncbi:MAG: tyrosine-type recombinase/integrase [Candidatus Kapabacteria bacterium]|nr:tyrosine-type recombinase/integrase [Ignavibacteriota bacterium]MCW5886408.1 tyrosine-type recombinase/integrase [Candidatus Kapabacteria bacterium]